MDIRHNLVGESPAAAELLRLVAVAASVDVSVLIQGESGTGKELVARAIHENSSRSHAPFVAINCAELSENLLESELYGHEKGAFTGALYQKKGHFERADRGTLFLDEIGEMPLLLQARLLRALQERRIRRLGGAFEIPVDIRIIAATHQDIGKSLREDLRYRLNDFPIRTPALRQRAADIPVLIRHFIMKYNAEFKRAVTGISEEAEALLCAYRWPGNIRELQSVIRFAVIMAPGGLLVPDNFELDFRPATPEAPVPDDSSLNYTEKIHAAKRALLQTAWNRANGSLTKTAALLGLTPTYVSVLLDKMGMTHLKKHRTFTAATQH
jgi:DNA-binding NtrC family response regulator